MAERRWSRRIRIHRGKLHGWHEHESEDARHEALRRSVRADGYATTVRRLNLLHNLADRENNEGLRRVAHEDEHWMEHMHAEGML